MADQEAVQQLQSRLDRALASHPARLGTVSHDRALLQAALTAWILNLSDMDQIMYINMGVESTARSNNEELQAVFQALLSLKRRTMSPAFHTKLAPTSDTQVFIDFCQIQLMKESHQYQQAQSLLANHLAKRPHCAILLMEQLDLFMFHSNGNNWDQVLSSAKRLNVAHQYWLDSQGQAVGRLNAETFPRDHMAAAFAQLWHSICVDYSTITIELRLKDFFSVSLIV